MSKFCKDCDEDHPLDQFFVCNNKSTLSNGTVKIYTVYRCKKTVLSKQQKYEQLNRDEILKKHKEYYIANKENHSKKSKIYRENNKDQIKAAKKVYAQKSETKIKIKEKKQTYEGTIRNLVMKRRQYNKKLGFECDIDTNYIKELIEKQNSNCIYCGQKLEIKMCSNNLAQISVDRIDSNIHYTKNNIQLTCLFCNLAKNDVSDDIYKKFIEVLKGKQHDFQYTEGEHKFSGLRGACLGSDRRKGFDNNNTITINEIKQLLTNQNNKCALSRVELLNAKDRSFPLKMSVDRIDSSKGHTLENCQIVCLGVQRGKLNYPDEDVRKYIEEIKNS